jgi:hypothetical protein
MCALLEEMNIQFSCSLGASAEDHERRSLDTSIPSTSSKKQHPPARAAVNDNQLEFIGRKIMNYLTNIINL